MSLRQIRVKLAVFAVLSLLAPTLGLPVWSQIALLTATLAIPAAVALHGGRRLLGMLVPLPPGTGSGQGSPDRAGMV